MSNLKQIAGVNLLILFLYTVLINATSTGSERGLAVAIFMSMCIAAQVVVNLIAAIVNSTESKSGLGKSFLLSAGIVLLIGFSACLGVANY